jgi:hypothetical protein
VNGTLFVRSVVQNIAERLRNSPYFDVIHESYVNQCENAPYKQRLFNKVPNAT